MKARKPLGVLLFSVAIMALLVAGCSKNAEEPPSNSDSQSIPAPAPTHSSSQPVASAPSEPSSVSTSPEAGASVAGITWAVPSDWTPQGDRPMRIATYSIPAAAGETDGGECAVFYFGSGQGGDVRSNIDRWIGQFKDASKPEESSRTVNGLQVTTVKVGGTYLAPSGPMMQSSGEKQGYLLIGTIVEAPEGPVFFKSTGPAATMKAAEKDITALVDSIRKTS